MGQQEKFLILDTNIILLDSNHILTLGQDGTIIVLPQTVINELDSKKSVPGELGYQVRSFGRLIAKGEIQSVQRQEDLVITPILLEDGTMVHVTSTSTYPDFSDVDPHTLNDRKIIEIALQYKNIYSDVTFMSNDVMCRITSNALGLPCTDFKVTEKTSYEFIKTLNVNNPEIFRTLNSTPIIEVDPEYKYENCSYKFTSTQTNQIKLGTILNGSISILSKEAEKYLRKQDCPAINSEQLLASKAILDPLVDLVIIEGLAGSGKNIVALSNAIKLLKTSKDKYDGIVYIRTPINDESPGEDIGYLSGNEEKLAMYLGPLKDSLDFIVRQNVTKKSSESIEDFDNRVDTATHKVQAECGIEAAISTGWRGRTLHNKVVILDEWTNASLATSQKILTRVGKNCKVIVIGSLSQIDSPYLSRFNNGISILLDEVSSRKVETSLNIFAINLHKVVRSEMALFAEDLHK